MTVAWPTGSSSVQYYLTDADNYYDIASILQIDHDKIYNVFIQYFPDYFIKFFIFDEYHDCETEIYQYDKKYYFRGVNSVPHVDLIAKCESFKYKNITFDITISSLEDSKPQELLPIILADYLFEPNDKITRNRIIGEITQIYNNKYNIICDETNNCSSAINSNQLVVDLYDKDKINYHVVVG